MKLKTMAFISLGLAGAGSLFGQTVLSEDFSDATAFTTSSGLFADTFGDFLGLAGGVDDFGGAAVPPGLKAYTGFSGGFLTGMDLDGEGATLPVTVTWSGLDITGLSNLQFSGKFAEFFDSPGDIDELDILRVEAQIDGGGFATVLEFIPADYSSTSGNFNGFFTLGGLTLGDAAQTFSAPIVGSGSLLDLRLVVSVDAGDEDFAVDDFVVSVVPEPSTYAALIGLLALGLVMIRRRKA